MQAIVSGWNQIKKTFKPTSEEWDISLTPWRLKVQMEGHPLEVLFYYKTHLEAKNQEDVLKQKGWASQGIDWHLD